MDEYHDDVNDLKMDEYHMMSMIWKWMNIMMMSVDYNWQTSTSFAVYETMKKKHSEHPPFESLNIEFSHLKKVMWAWT
jgi:hypothetical protein